MSDKIKHIPEQKLKAFSIGAMGKRTLSKKELEEQRKKEEERAAAHVFQEFVETFQDAPVNSTKIWVKAGTYDAGAQKEDTKDKGKLYKPQSRIVTSQELMTSAERAQAYARMLAVDKKPERLGKKKASGKSNLELFKEELRQIQEEREERHKYKGTIMEPQLMEIFGRFGPLASIKIMWPRSDEEKARGRNCGFVAYMSRKDGERALHTLNGKDVLGYEMKLGWGKSVVIPAHPIYVPPALLELSMPAPASGLPFNAQPVPKDKDILPTTAEELNEILFRAYVKVVIPADRNLLMLIHRMVEFVTREGPMFEAMIMNREIHNPLFRFLFENQNPLHIYYRWKLYSIMHGDSQKEWTSKEFRMFKGGSIWKPPILANYTSGMPDELIHQEELREARKGSLSNTQRDRLEDLIRNLTPEAKKIADAMVFCIEHSDAANEVADCILESLSNESTLFTKKMARIYLISDILHNCGVKVNKASFYRRAFESRLIEIMKQIKMTHDRLEGRLQAEGFKVRVLRTLKAWEDSIYPKDFMTVLHNVFLGSEEVKDDVVEEQNWDGNPLQEQIETDEDVPMDGMVLLKAALKQNLKSPPSPAANIDIDGFEIADDDKKEDMTQENGSNQLSGFILSKWETVDPEQVEAQAMTTSKWDLLESSADNSQESKNDSQEGIDYTDLRDLTEEKRTKLREIELKIVQYQDELESAHRCLKSGWTVLQQVEHYRRKLLKKSEKEWKEKEKDNSTVGSKSEKHKRDWEKMDRDSSDDDVHYKDVTPKKIKKHARSSPTRSTPKHRSKSRSPPSRKKTVRAPSSPSSPRIRRHSPRPRHRNSISPDNSKYSKYSPSSPRSRYSRRSPSPSNKYHSSATPRSRYKGISPDVSRKHKHKH
ncbi:hypothetical protein FQA39_LY12269 [Lamprigera yunnana]|nr:hypothetical protein FQA39_LY12269 [Lamprigera yunnana]